MQVHCDPLEQAAAAAVLADVPTGVVVEELRTAGDELVALRDESDSISRNVETLERVGESLEHCLNAYMTNVHENDWNSRVERQYHVSVESICKAAGIVVTSSRYVPSTENAEVKETNQENKKSNMQKGKDFLKKIWEAVATAVTSFLKNMVDFITNIGKNSGAVVKAGQNLKAKAAAASGSPASESLGMPKWAGYLYVNNKQETAMDALTQAGGWLTMLLTDWLNGCSTIVTEIQKAMGSNSDVNWAAAEKTLTTSKYDPDQPFNSKVVIEQGNSDGMPTWTLKITKGEVKPNAVSTLSLDEVKRIADEIVKTGGILKDVEKKLSDTQKLVSALNGAVKSAVSANKEVKFKPKVINKLLVQMMAGPKAAIPFVVDVTRAAFAHGNESLKQYKGGGGSKIDRKSSNDEKEGGNE